MSAYRFEKTTLQAVQRLPSIIGDHGPHAIEAELAIGGVEDLSETVRQNDECQSWRVVVSITINRAIGHSDFKGMSAPARRLE